MIAAIAGFAFAALFASVPFGDRTAFSDFGGQIEFYFIALSQATKALNLTPFRLLPLGTPGSKEWLSGMQQQVDAASQVLGVGSVDVGEYDLRDPNDHASFCFVLSQVLDSLRLAAGLS